MSKKLTTEEFIEKAKVIHGDKYDYSLVDYINAKTRISIICPEHGVFEQRPDNHLEGNGCPLCGNLTISKKLSKKSKAFIEQAKQIYGDKYDYSTIDYTNSQSKIKVICPKHGCFEIRAGHFLQGHACRYCGIDKTTNFLKDDLNSFVQKAREIHGDKYDYSLVDYENTYKKIKIICPVHGEFEQRPNNHLNGYGCPICSESKGERKIRIFLKNNNIHFFQEYRFKDCKDKKSLPFDFYIPSKNLLIEYNDGQHYKSVKHFGGQNSFLIRKHHDWLKRKYARDNNIKLLTIPYWDFKIIDELLKESLA